MAEFQPITAAQCEGIRAYDTCKIANAIERLGLRMKNEGFTRPGLVCRISGYASALGYSVTSRVRSADPPVRGYSFAELEEWWAAFERFPWPRLAVIEDIDQVAGQGAALSNIHAEVLRALGCAGLVTNGSVRNLPELDRMRFPVFSCHVAVSHAYIHMVEFNAPVEILGLPVQPRDLIYADCHGAISIPEAQVDDIVRVAGELASAERRTIDLCHAGRFPFSALAESDRSC
ncbi:MAG: RraA family protein [Acidobacteria bacterium]|nr:RraA family protein [Acidobacteriota bacterium]